MNMQNIKGIMATVLTGMSAITAWLSEIEVILRAGVSVVGIVAGIYAANYWRNKSKLLKAGKDKNEV